MKSYDNKLPSNKKFGYFFSTIFFISAAYFFYSSIETAGYILIILMIFFFVTTIINADLLLPLNKLWARFGLLLGLIVNPIVLGVIFFGFFAPYGIIMRIIGRDELSLKQVKNSSCWVKRSNDLPQTNFKKQF